MRNIILKLTLALVATMAVGSQTSKYAGVQCEDPALTASQQAGCKIWFYATAGNGRFHTYVFQQRVNVLIDWYRVLNAPQRADRFRAFGLMNDPGCCVPGSKGCPRKSLDETFGFDYCPGDDVLLNYVGKPGYRDPACDPAVFQDAARDPKDVHGAKDQRQTPCDLEFGTSAGAMGLRKFPNPRFKAEAWKKVDGWVGYRAKRGAAGVSHLSDGSVEPPFLVGMACGACHIAFDPLNPPRDPANPTYANLKGAVGNQYARFSEIMASGMNTNSLAWQMFAHARPGSTDTSAVATDQLNNAGTMNALINFDQRPVFPGEQVDKWRKVASCPAGAKGTACWCEPGRDGKCWQRSVQTEAVHHILKGGEDSTGAAEAVQRVYFNIGSCSEACWVNHFSDLKQVDPTQRNSGQTPFDVGQCRRDCPNFRAIEDRLPDIVNFLASQRPFDLHVARGLKSRQDLIEQLDREFGAGAVARGKGLFNDNCARCHSSQKGPIAGRDYYATNAEGVRIDWMGNDESTPATEVGTYRARALHSNHKSGHVYQEYGSNTMRARKMDPNIAEAADGGRGYFRNISLLSVWAFAPFLHNNSVGPEVCGQPANRENEFYRTPYVTADRKPLANAPRCWPYDPSVKGRFDLYKASMDELLNPKQRIPKVALLTEDIPLDVGPKFWHPLEKKKVGFRVVIPAGLPVSLVGNLQHKLLIVDLIQSMTDFEALKKGPRGAYAEELRAMAKGILTDSLHTFYVLEKRLTPAENSKRLALIHKLYLSSTALVENEGHRFGEDLSAADKKALTAFLATL